MTVQIMIQVGDYVRWSTRRGSPCFVKGRVVGISSRMAEVVPSPRHRRIERVELDSLKYWHKGNHGRTPVAVR